MAGKPVDTYCGGGMTTAFAVGTVLLLRGSFAVGHDMAGRVRIKPLDGGIAFAEPLAVGVKLVTSRFDKAGPIGLG